MHSMQLMLLHLDDVEITDNKRIEHRVESILDGARNEANYDWFDWWAIGGRWDHWLTEKTSKDIWPNQLESRTAIQLTPDNKLVVLKLLDEVDNYMKEALEEHIKYISEHSLTLEDYLKSEDIRPSDHFSWRVRKALDIKDNEWGFESTFVDSQHWFTSSTAALRKALAGEEKVYDYPLEEFALVVIDFHH